MLHGAVVLLSVALVEGSSMAAEEWGNRVLTVYGAMGAPFQADFEERQVVTADDGSEIVAARVGRIYVDGARRSREEFTAPPAREERPGQRAPGPTVHLAVVNDPMAGLTFVVDLAANSVLEQRRWTEAEKQEGRTPGPFGMIGAGERIGSRAIEGLLCDGFRVRQEGLDAESWYSPEIGQVVLETARVGSTTTTYRLSNVRRGEPDSSLFAPPAVQRP